MDLDQVVCTCLDITKGMIKDAVAGGAKTPEAVQEATGAGTICGACLDEVQEVVEQFVKEGV